MGLLDGKIGLIAGVANENSLAWHCAKAWHENGADLIFTCKEHRLEKVTELVATLDDAYPVIPCDAESDDDIYDLFTEISDRYSKLDIFLHSIAAAPRVVFDDPFTSVSRDDFMTAFNASVYSFIAMSREASSLMSEGGSIITISYIGVEKVVPVYNIMGPAKAALEASVKYVANDFGADGIRVNAISSGPVPTLAARGIPGFRDILERDADVAPLARNVTGSDIGSVSLFLASDLSQGITGEIIHVDCGANLIIS